MTVPSNVTDLDASTLTAVTHQTTELPVTPQTTGPVVWVDDSARDSCMKCHVKFSGMRRRRHHCRMCGHLVCSSCARGKQVVPLELLPPGTRDPTVPQRVCNECSDAPVSPPPQPIGSFLSRQDTANLTMEETAVKPAFMRDLDKPVPPNFDLAKAFGTLTVRVVEACGLIASDPNWLGAATSSDPYCVVRISDGPSVRTRTLPKTLEPRWNEGASFLLSRCDPVLHLSFFDEDRLDADDHLGSVQIPLDALHTSSSPFKGWFPLLAPDGDEEVMAGSVFLELQLVDIDPKKHVMSYILPPEPLPTPAAPFDIDKIYSPGMQLKDLLWDRCFYHVLCKALDIVFWTSPKTSALVFVGWNVSTSYLKHWPAGSLLALLGLMLKHRSNFELSRKQSPKPIVNAFASPQPSPKLSPKATAEEGDHLPSSVRFLVKSGIPQPQKDLCVFLAPIMRMGADLLEKVRSVMTWEDACSPHVAAALIVGAAMCEVFKFSTILKFLGSSTLLAKSPVLKAALGLVAYIKWYRGDDKQAPVAWRMQASFDETTLSTHASAATRAAGLRWKANAAAVAAEASAPKAETPLL